MNNLGTHSIEIISLIVQRINQTHDLYNCSLINKQFHTATNPLLWRKLNIMNETTFKAISTSIVISHPAIPQHVRHLTLGHSITDQQLLVLMKRIPHLETLTIHRANGITDDSLQQLPHHCPHLTSIELYQVPITMLSMGPLAQHCRQLVKLVLKSTPPLPPTVFSILTHHCPLLQELAISIHRRPDGTTQKAWLACLDTAVNQLGQLSHLTCLKIECDSPRSDIGARIVIIMTGLQQPSLSSLLSSSSSSSTWPHLTQLTLSGCRNVAGYQLDAFLQAHPNIHTLELHDLFRTTNSLTPVANHLRGIRSLVLGTHGEITPQALCHFIHQCPSLTRLAFLDAYGLVFEKDDFPGVFDDDDDNNNNNNYGYMAHGEYTRDLINKIRCRPDPGQPNLWDEDEDKDGGKYSEEAESSDDQEDDKDDGDWLP